MSLERLNKMEVSDVLLLIAEGEIGKLTLEDGQITDYEE